MNGAHTSTRWRMLAGEIGKFGTVGAIGWLVDVGVFNLLRTAPWSPLADQPIAAKTISMIVAILVTWIGNRSWTFEPHEGRTKGRELSLFLAFSAGGMLINNATLWFSHYVLGFTSALADNISGNVIGFGLATLFRFYTYRRFVFRSSHHRAHAASVSTGDTPLS